MLALVDLTLPRPVGGGTQTSGSRTGLSLLWAPPVGDGEKRKRQLGSLVEDLGEAEEEQHSVEEGHGYCSFRGERLMPANGPTSAL